MAVQLLCACAAQEEVLPAGEGPAIREDQTWKALFALNRLRRLDAFIRLDNALLGERIRSQLQAQAQAMDGVAIDHLEVGFGRQHIALEARLLATVESGRKTGATLSGDVLLAFSGGQLIWLPRFSELAVSDNESGSSDNPADPLPVDVRAELLDRVNREVADTVIVAGKNVLGIDPIPPGRIEVGARLLGVIDVAAANSRELGGAFTVAGSAILIEPSVTSIALDLEFIPGISRCPADIYVSRSAFARQVRAREPVGMTRLVDELGDTTHFFTEISGASRSTAVIHYWFADGQPVAVKELPVEPSHRWRTWSSQTIDRAAGNWEVIVVEKGTGCVLHSSALRADPAIGSVASASAAAGQTTFEQYRREFRNRAGGFSILAEEPEVASMEVPRNFLAEVLRASLQDIRINVDFDISEPSGRQVSATLQPFAAGSVACEERTCAARRECRPGFSQCMRRRDTRDCGTCLFRNPLNGRCVRESEDPICEAARDRQNEIYASEFESCRSRETAAQADCERLRDQEIRSCVMEAASRKSACEAGREAVVRLAGEETIATATGRVRMTGGLRAVFSNFEVEGELSGLRQKLGFSAALDLDGTLGFSPHGVSGPLANCLARWRGSYRSRVVMPLAANSMFGSMEERGPVLETAWSGYELSAAVTPAPLETVFVEQPELLAECGIGLTVGQVAGRMSGADGAYFAGRIGFEIQPLPSRIELAPGTVTVGGTRYQSPPVLGPVHLRFDIGRP